MRRVWLPRRVHRHGDDDEPVASRVEPAQAAAPANPPRDALGLGHPIPSLSRRIRKSPPRRRTLYIKGTTGHQVAPNSRQSLSRPTVRYLRLLIVKSPVDSHKSAD